MNITKLAPVEHDNSIRQGDADKVKVEDSGVENRDTAETIRRLEVRNSTTVLTFRAVFKISRKVSNEK